MSYLQQRCPRPHLRQYHVLMFFCVFAYGCFGENIPASPDFVPEGRDQAPYLHQVLQQSGDIVVGLPGSDPDPKAIKDLKSKTPKKVCVGGHYDQSDIVHGCNSNADCPGVCNGGPFKDDACTNNFDCNYYCAGGTNYCENDHSRLCGPDNPCPGQCQNSGDPCQTNTDCGRTCAGGIHAGESCVGQRDCPGECYWWSQRW